MDVSRFYGVDYNYLKEFLKNCSKEDRNAILADPIIKAQLIDSQNVYEFIYYIQQMPTECILPLLDEEGIAILSRSDHLTRRLTSILTMERSDLEPLYQSLPFQELLTSHFSIIQDTLEYLPLPSAVAYFQYLAEQNSTKLMQAYLAYRDPVQLEISKTVPFSFEQVEQILYRGKKNTITYLLQNDVRITSLDKASYDNLLRMIKKGVQIPPHLLTEKAFVNKLATMNSVTYYRFLVNELKENHDTTDLEKERRKAYDKEFSSFDQEYGMLKSYADTYRLLLKRKDEGTPFLNTIEEIETNLCFFGDEQHEFFFREKLSELWDEKDQEKLKEFFKRESDLRMSDMMIDYHFSEMPHNFFLDLKELIEFQKKEGRTLSSEDLTLYMTLLHLDDCPPHEKIQLHESLKKKNMQEKYYDDFRSAKDRVGSLIEEVMLTKERITPYQDEELSKTIGVPIYSLSGEPFYAVVKALGLSKAEVLQPTFFTDIIDGASYSLDASFKLKTFGDPKEVYHVVYGTFPKQQLVHTFPLDSFSYYQREYRNSGSDRVYKLNTPFELVTGGSGYNELLLALPNEQREDGISEHLERPKILGIYCYDEITPNDIESAKNLNCGIVVVDTKSYHVKSCPEAISLCDVLSEDYLYHTDPRGVPLEGRRKH